jgi:hypothetical protein
MLPLLLPGIGAPAGTMSRAAASAHGGPILGSSTQRCKKLLQLQLTPSWAHLKQIYVRMLSQSVVSDHHAASPSPSPNCVLQTAASKLLLAAFFHHQNQTHQPITPSITVRPSILQHLFSITPRTTSPSTPRQLPPPSSVVPVAAAN